MFGFFQEKRAFLWGNGVWGIQNTWYPLLFNFNCFFSSVPSLKHMIIQELLYYLLMCT